MRDFQRVQFERNAQETGRPVASVSPYDPGKAGAFAAAIERYLPAIDAAWLAPDYAGIRPRLAGPGEAFRDFVVAEESAAGWPGFVNLIGIESPGLTAASAIGARVAELLAGLS